MSLTGVTQKRIDSKGRLSVPKKLRDLLVNGVDDEITVLKLDGCIQLYPRRTWAEIRGKIEELSPFDQRTRKLQRFWGMNSDCLIMDNEGRITLSRDQKVYAGIKRDVILVGAINKVEIWELEIWQKMMTTAPELADVASEVADIT